MRPRVTSLTALQAGGTSRNPGRFARDGRATASGRTRPLVLLLGLAVVGAGLGGCTATPPPAAMMISDGHAAGGSRRPPRRITREELTQRLMAFADRYLSRVSEATDKLKRDATDPQVRRAAHATKFFPGSAMLTFAAEPDPVAGMLDMLTVVTLERMVWQDTGWAVEVFGAEGAEVLRKAQVDAENDIWSCAAAVLPQDRLRDVRQVIVDWHRAHPERRYVSTMRFDDFAADGGDLARRAAVAARAASKGFLAPINEATRAVDETRMWGERFVFITGRLQRMMSWQAEMFVYEMALTPEFKQVIGNHQVMAEGVRRFGGAVEAWPNTLAREREALLKGFDERTGAAGEVVKNFRAAMTEAQPVAADVRRTGESAAVVASELRGLIRDVKPLLEEVARLSGKAPAVTSPAPAPGPATPGPATPGPATPGAAAVVAAAVTPADPVPPADPAAGEAAADSAAADSALPIASSPDVAQPAAARGSGQPSAAPPAAASAPAPGPYDVKQYESLVRELNALVNSTDELLASRAWQSRLNEVNNAAETRVAHASREGRELINYGFYRGVFFAMFCAAVLFATALLYRFTARRLFPQSHRPSA